MTDSFEYIFVKDMHLMFKFRNNIRKHGWEKDIDYKLKQIIDYMVVNNIKYLFTAGDIFEKTKDWSFKQFQANMDRLKLFKKAGITLFSNLGNHDMTNGRESVEDTVFQAAVELGLVTHVGSDMAPYKFLTQKDKEVLLFGIDYHQSLTRVLDELDVVSNYKRQTESASVKLLLIHSNITDKNIQLTDFSYEQLSQFDIDIINCGHYHLVPEGGAIQEVGGTHFLNPWNLTRVSRDYAVKLDEHRPEFIHARINFVPDPVFDFQEIFLETKKFSEAFNIDLINMLQELGKSEFDFFKNIELEQDEDMNSDEKLLETLAEAHKITKESIQIAKELLT